MSNYAFRWTTPLKLMMESATHKTNKKQSPILFEQSKSHVLTKKDWGEKDMRIMQRTFLLL